MSYENASITWGANQLAAMVSNGKIIFESIVQRSYVWEKTRASKFIESQFFLLMLKDMMMALAKEVAINMIFWMVSSV